MLRNSTFTTILILWSLTLHGQRTPVIGTSNQLEIANWNLEWYGKTASGYGPDNDALQQELVRNLLDSTQIDIWGLCEIADTAVFSKSIQAIGRYKIIFSKYSAEQKTAVLIDTNQYRIVNYSILATQSPDSFSSSRFPLEVNLIPKNILGPDTLTIIVLHLKSNIGTTSEKMQAYNSRLRSSEWLNMYLNQRHKNNYVAVIGDWNDDVDLSIYNQLPSPFNNLTKNGSSFHFVTKKLSVTKVSSTVSYSDFIDHQLISGKLKNLNLKDTAFVVRPDQWIKQYGIKVSDHYPVYSSYSNLNSNLPKKLFRTINIFPNPANNSIQIEGIENGTLQILDARGKLISSMVYTKGDQITLDNLVDGIYTLYLQSENTVFYAKFAVLK